MVKAYFPFVYGYILGMRKYANTTKKELITRYTQAILHDGVKDSIQSANWISKRTKDTLVRKAEKMKVVIGLPDATFNLEKVDRYYASMFCFDCFKG